MPAYKILKQQSFYQGNYKIIPIRHQDRLLIMKWRNEQIYHLRQAKPLTEEDQENYFKSIITKLFDQESPGQILFSYLENEICIGYGGLVHINWLDKHAEISFIMNTELERVYFRKHWGIYLDLIEKVAFSELKLHKIFTYAFDLRPNLYEILEEKGYKKEATLKEHCLIGDQFKNVVIHSKINRQIVIRKALEGDVILTYEWANDELTRRNSFSSEYILLEDHQKWWLSKLQSGKAFYFIFELEGKEAGIVRFDENMNDDHFTTGITLAPEFRGKGLAEVFLEMACNEFSKSHSNSIDAFIKKDNTASIKCFENANFKFSENLMIQETESLKYIWENHAK